MKLHQRAFSLLELLVTGSLIAVFVSISIPAVANLVRTHQEEVIREQLLALLHESRTQAVTRRVPVELCGASNSNACNGDWRTSWRMNEAGGRITRAYQVTHADGLIWKGFKPSIGFSPNGTSPLGNGRFVMCRGNSPTWELIINRQGRVRQVPKNQLSVSCTTSRPAS